MKIFGENGLKKLISLIKGEIATKQDKITTTGVLFGNGDGTLSKATADDLEASVKVADAVEDNVANALSALTLGKPLDMTEDFEASGAGSLEEWAAMAKSGNTDEYRVPPGKYYLRNYAGLLYNVVCEIYDISAGSSGETSAAYRSLYSTHFDDEFIYINLSLIQRPGGEFSQLFSLSSEEFRIVKGNNQLMSLPHYDDRAGSYSGKFLYIDKDGFPSWGTTPYDLTTEIDTWLQANSDKQFVDYFYQKGANGKFIYSGLHNCSYHNVENLFDYQIRIIDYEYSRNVWLTYSSSPGDGFVCMEGWIADLTQTTAPKRMFFFSTEETTFLFGSDQFNRMIPQTSSQGQVLKTYSEQGNVQMDWDYLSASDISYSSKIGSTTTTTTKEALDAIASAGVFSTTGAAEGSVLTMKNGKMVWAALPTYDGGVSIS